MKFSHILIIFAGLAFAANSYADHQRSDTEFEARYRYSSGKGHHAHKHHHKHDVYYVHDHHDHYRQHESYYVRHVHTRHCGHYYEPAFNTRVKVFLGI